VSAGSTGRPRPAAVLWDADGVLQTVPRGWEHTMRPVVEGQVDDVERFLVEAFEAEAPSLRGDVPWSHQLTDLLERWGVPHLHDEALRVWFTILRVDDVWDLVRRVRDGGVECHLASNQDRARADHMRREIGYDGLLDSCFFSCDLGAAKPQPEFFRAILDRLGVEPQRALFVDDNPVNVAEAGAFGLRALCWNDREDVGLLHDWLVEQGALDPS
jgi:putative hydrolase of the HAD superfamily